MEMENKIYWRLDSGQIKVVDDLLAEVLSRRTHTERLKQAFDM